MTVKIKPLVWAAYTTDEGTSGFAATTTIGRYLTVNAGWFLVGKSGWNVSASIEDAKVAAQADYEARILAAIEAPVQEPAAWRRKHPSGEFWEYSGVHLTDVDQPLYTTPPDHLALVAAAYRDAADKALNGNIETQGHQGMALEISCSTPADAEAHLTAMLRAEYERGVRDAAEQIADTCPHADVPGGNCTPDTFDEGTSAAYEAVLALLTQEGR